METVNNIAIPVGENYASKVGDKRVLYFSDGQLELNDNVELTEPDSPQTAINPKELGWAPWVWYQTVTVGTKTLEVCDYLGEGLASFFGITTPKYQFEINEYNRIKKAQEEETKSDLEMGSWIGNNGKSSENGFTDTVVSSPVVPSSGQAGRGDGLQPTRY